MKPLNKPRYGRAVLRGAHILCVFYKRRDLRKRRQWAQGKAAARSGDGFARGAVGGLEEDAGLDHQPGLLALRLR